MNSNGTASNGSTRAPCMIASGFAPPGQNVSCRGIRHGQADLPNHASSLTPTLKHSFTHSQCDSLTQLLTLNPVPTDHFHSHSVSHPQFLCPQITILRQEVVSKEMPPPEVVAPSNPSKPLAPTAAAAATLLARQRRYAHTGPDRLYIMAAALEPMSSGLDHCSCAQGPVFWGGGVLVCTS